MADSHSTTSALLALASQADGRTILTLTGEIDLTTTCTLRTEVHRCLRERPAHLSLDLRSVTFCDAAGMRALRWARRQAADVQAKFSIVAPSQRVERLLTVAGATDLLSLVQYPPQEPSATNQPSA